MKARLLAAILLPFLALGLQWLLWPWIAPFVWFLFFPTVFFSARLGGLWGGLVSSVLSAGIVWYFFLPPQLSWSVAHPANMYSVGVFLFMGYLFSDAHERLRRAQKRTEAALSETRAANEKITELYRKTLELDELKSQFFANVSHELRTPLTLIMSPLLLRLALPERPAEERAVDEMMLRNARLLYRHVSDLLDAAKLESGRMCVEYARLDMGALVRAMAAHFDSLAREKGITYRIEAATPLMAEVDGEKVQRILLNLLSNAFKFTPDDGCIQVRLREEAATLLLEVEDTGPGVPADMRTAVFERFHQLEGGVQRRFGGTGLGLSIVKEFTELHGGSVEVVEATGGGALFRVRLPLHAPEGSNIEEASTQLDPLIDHQTVDELRPGARAAAQPSGAAESAPLVLVVEDNPDMNAFITEILRPYYRVAAAFDGREGLEKARALRPNLILSDVMMPVMSGDQMVQELRRLPALAEVPIVMLTAKADDELRVRLFKEGVQGYVNKPFAVDELLARVGGLIAERSRAAEKLSTSDTRFEATFEQAAVGIALVALDGHWLRVNKKLCDIVGYSAEELMEKTFQDITYAEDLEADLELVRSMLAGALQVYASEKRYIRKNGSLVWINISVALVRRADGAPDYFVSVIEDIQARKSAEATLRESQAKLQAALASMSDAVFIADTEGRFIDFNEAFASFYKFRSKAECPNTLAEVREFVDLYTLDGKLAAPEHRPLPRALRGESAINAEYTLRRRDTGETWVGSFSFAPIRDRDGMIVGSVVAGRDITAQKHAEEEIRQLNTHLESRVLERTAELSAANRELDSFAYAVSHDLRAPLRAMNGFSQALVEDYGPLLQGEAHSYLQQIVIASHKMNELIDGLLALSRCTRGDIHRTPVDLSAMAERLLADLARAEPQRRVAASVAPGLAAQGDERMLEAALGNLLGNAWKYTAHATASSIRVYAEDRQGERYFCVADNGAGFDMAHAGRLFEPFQRLHRQDEFPGIGIGLATVQRIVHRHGGEIDAQAESGKGAVFCFSLPTTAPADHLE